VKSGFLFLFLVDSTYHVCTVPWIQIGAPENLHPIIIRQDPRSIIYLSLQYNSSESSPRADSFSSLFPPGLVIRGADIQPTYGALFLETENRTRNCFLIKCFLNWKKVVEKKMKEPEIGPDAEIVIAI
jgi:hypothetical protein